MVFTAQATLAVDVKTKISSEIGQKNLRPVTFKNGQIIMAGNLYLPDNFDERKQYPTIIVTHPGGGVKEQTAGLYVQKLAKKDLSPWHLMLLIKVKAVVNLDF